MKTKIKKCIPITKKELKEINERLSENLREAKITHLPPGIERAEVNLKSFLEILKELQEKGKCPLRMDQSGIVEILLTIISYVRGNKSKT